MKVKDEIINGDLRPCPFCGNANIQVCTCHDLEDCENFESCEDVGYYSTVCDINNGGCGSSSRYCPTIAAAVDVWNKRQK